MTDGNRAEAEEKTKSVKKKVSGDERRSREEEEKNSPSSEQTERTWGRFDV